MKTSTKMLLIQLSATFGQFGRNIKYMFSDFARGIRDAYYFYRGDYDLKQFGTRKEDNLEFKWIKRESCGS